jgi:putative spermidine/putrescine transport system permease protein
VAATEGASLRPEAVRRPRPLGGLARWVGEGLAAWLPALPLLVLALVLLIAPTVELVVSSIHSSAAGWTLAFWRDTLQSAGGQRAVRTSIQLALICATLSLLVGGPLAWMISRMVTLRRSIWLALLNVAANFGGVGLAFGYIAALGSYGMVTLALHDVGIPIAPPAMGSVASLVLAYEYTNVPLFILLTLPAMAILRTEWMEAAETCAASRAQFWRHIGLPILAPFLAAGWLLIFTWSIGIYGLAYAMGANASTVGKLRLITLQIGLTLNTGAGREERAFVLAVVLLMFATVSLVAYRLTLRWALRWFV